jgi:hypothetical protein
VAVPGASPEGHQGRGWLLRREGLGEERDGVVRRVLGAQRGAAGEGVDQRLVLQHEGVALLRRGQRLPQRVAGDLRGVDEDREDDGERRVEQRHLLLADRDEEAVPGQILDRGLVGGTQGLHEVDTGVPADVGAEALGGVGGDGDLGAAELRTTYPGGRCTRVPSAALARVLQRGCNVAQAPRTRRCTAQ